MFERSSPDRSLVARVIVWLALSVAFLAYIGWGTELTSVTSFFFIRRDVGEIWSFFREDLPDVGNARLLAGIYWVSIGTLIVGALVLFWLALAPQDSGRAVSEMPEITANDT